VIPLPPIRGVPRPVASPLPPTLGDEPPSGVFHKRTGRTRKSVMWAVGAATLISSCQPVLVDFVKPLALEVIERLWPKVTR
jgi:hypothetical protein